MKWEYIALMCIGLAVVASAFLFGVYGFTLASVLTAWGLTRPNDTNESKTH